MKKLLSVLTGFVVTMAAIAVLLTTGVNTKTASAEDPHTHCTCGGNVAVLNDATAAGHTEAVAVHGACSAITWTAWTDATKFPTATGNYYLTVDVTSAHMKPEENANIVVCLNGHTVNQTAERLISNVTNQKAFNLSICDCTGNGKIVSKTLTDNNDGGTFWVRSQTCNFNFYNITIDASKRNVTTKGGTVLKTSSACNVNIFDGLYLGGTAGRGGTFAFTGGTFNMFGGTISGGVSKVASTATQTSIGGNVFMSGGTMNLVAGTIQNGRTIAGNGAESKPYGADAGNVGMLSGTLNISDGFKLVNGSATNASNITYDYNAWIWHGTFNGDSYATGSYMINWHFHCECGENSNTEGTTHVCNSNVEWQSLSDTPSLEDGKDYYFYLTQDWTGSPVFGTYEAQPVDTNVYLCLNGYNITADYSRGLLAWLNGGTLTICDCLAHGEGDSYVAGRIGTNPERTTYIDCKTQQGYVISFKGAVRVYNGIIDASMTDRDNWGGAIYAGKFVEIYGGKIIGGLVRSRDLTATSTKGGGAVYATSTFTMYGGEIEGGIVKASGECRGGSVSCGSTFTMYGGKISGGTTLEQKAGGYAKGGCVFSNSTFTMYGGEISGGSCNYESGANTSTGVWWACAGLVYMNGANNFIYGGTLSNGYARSCGGIFIGGKNLTISNATITGCEGAGSGGNICSEGGTLTINEGTVISNGKSNSGGNIYIKKGAVVMNGGTITGGTATNGYGGNVYLNANGGTGTMTVNSGLIEKGTLLSGDKSLPNIAVLSTAVLTVKGGTITCDKPSYENAIWSANTATVDISGENTYITKLFAQSGAAAILHGGYLASVPRADSFYEGYGASALAEAKTSEGYSFGFEVCEGYHVTTMSWLVDSTKNKISSGISTITGGGFWKDSTAATMTATENANYAFLGWAEVADADATTCELISGATELTYTAPATDADKFYVAVYGTKNATVHYEVIGNAQVSGLEKSGDVALGTKITISFTGNSTFVGFTNEVNKMISTATEIELTLYSDTTVVAVEKAEVGTGEHEFIFLTESDQIYKTIVAASLTELPAVPVHYGKEGGFWSLTKGGAEATLEEINAAATADSLTLYLTGYTGKTPMKELTAKTEAQIAMNIAAATKVGDKFTVSLGATRLLPEGFTVVEQGILLTTGAKVADEAAAKEALVIGGTGIGKLRSTSTELSGVTSANVQNVPEDTTIYAVGYVIYLREGSTTPEYLYTAVSTVEAK